MEIRLLYEAKKPLIWVASLKIFQKSFLKSFKIICLKIFILIF